MCGRVGTGGTRCAHANAARLPQSAPAGSTTADGGCEMREIDRGRANRAPDAYYCAPWGVFLGAAETSGPQALFWLARPSLFWCSGAGPALLPAMWANRAARARCAEVGGPVGSPAAGPDVRPRPSAAAVASGTGPLLTWRRRWLPARRSNRAAGKCLGGRLATTPLAAHWHSIRGRPYNGRRRREVQEPACTAMLEVGDERDYTAIGAASDGRPVRTLAPRGAGTAPASRRRRG
jgi:hypothetical protein